MNLAKLKANALEYRNKLLFYNFPEGMHRLVIPDNEGLKRYIFKMHHDNIMGGHPGREELYQDVKRLVFWPKMYQDCAKYTKSCQVCQMVKNPKGETPGLLQSIPMGKSPWDVINIDFITKLPLIKQGNQMIITITDRFTNWSYFVPLAKPATAEVCAEALLSTVYRHHGMLNAIISDMDVRFTGWFWRQLINWRFN